MERLQAAEDAKSGKRKEAPKADYQEKYQHLIGKQAGKDAANLTSANTSYGFGEWAIIF